MVIADLAYPARRALALPQFFRQFFSQRIWWFALLGATLFALAWWQEHRAARVIVLSPAVQARLAAQWAGQAGRPPEPQEMRALLNDYIREEVLVREAQARGLDDGDVIIRRRLAQKMEYLLSAEQDFPAEPDETALRDFFTQHKDRYAAPAQFSFRQLHFEPLEAPLETALASLRDALAEDDNAWRVIGEPSMLAREWLRRDGTDVRRAFGDQFADGLEALVAKQTRGWTGPVYSVFGAHLVNLLDYTPRQEAKFAPLRARVAQDWKNAELQKQEDKRYDELRQKYRVR